MINHTVLFKLIDFATEAEKQKNIEKAKNDLLALKDIISELKFIEVGTNHEVTSDNFDIALITHFETIADLDAYQVHPEHKKVGAFLRTIMAGRACVDFTI